MVTMMYLSTRPSQQMWRQLWNLFKEHGLRWVTLLILQTGFRMMPQRGPPPEIGGGKPGYHKRKEGPKSEETEDAQPTVKDTM